AADRDHFRASVERVQPLGRRGHSRSDDRNACRERMWLVGVDGPRQTLEAGVPGRDQYVRERALAVELEAAGDRADLLDPARDEAGFPAAAPAHLVCMREEVVDARV